MNTDVVIVGAGVAGSALATALALRGLDVVLLEKSLAHRDRVRGEWLAPWGVAEAQKLGLYHTLIGAGAHHTQLHVPYSEGLEAERARSRALDLSGILDGVPGALCLQHTTFCNALNEAATDAGAKLFRGVSRMRIVGGLRPEMSFVESGTSKTIRARLIVGADGRGSQVARQSGIRMQHDPPHHLLAGLLVEGAHLWPERIQTIGVEADVAFYVFPQGYGRVRLYLCYGRDQHRRFSGPDGKTRFLEAFRLESVPESAALANAIPAGPCHSYPNEDSWAEVPVSDGIVLIGDAAGHNDPTIGQGLAIALRDARLVKDALLRDRDWRRPFTEYVAERRERMRRLRFVGRLVAHIRAEFDEAAKARRVRVSTRLATDPAAALPLLAPLRGPETLAHDAFEPAAWHRLTADT